MYLWVPMKGFCILHCLCRVTELIATQSCNNKKEKIDSLTKRFFAFGIIKRKTWKFILENGRYRPTQMFGAEAKRLFEKIKEVFPKDPLTQKAFETFKTINEIMNTNTVENVLKIDWNEKSKLLQNWRKELILAFGRAGITYYTHLIIAHLQEVMLELGRMGLTLPMISQQGLEQSNSVFKNTVDSSTSPAAVIDGDTELNQYLMAVYRPKMMEWTDVVPTYRVKKRQFKNGVHEPYKLTKKKSWVQQKDMADRQMTMVNNN